MGASGVGGRAWGGAGCRLCLAQQGSQARTHLANSRRLVARGLQQRRYSSEIARDALKAADGVREVETAQFTVQNVDVYRVAPRLQSGTGRRAVAVGIEAVELYTLPHKRVQVGGADLREICTSMPTRISMPPVINEEVEDVGQGSRRNRAEELRP